MTYALGSSSRAKLKGVHGDLGRIVLRAIELTPVDFSVIYGVRSPAEQAHLVAIGASRTLDSAHLHGLAVDLQPYLGPGVDPYPRKSDSREAVRAKLERFEAIARAMFQAADELGILLQWGNDWDVDGIPTGRDPDEKGWLQDLVHFQLPPHHRLTAANKRAHERIALRDQGKDVIS